MKEAGTIQMSMMSESGRAVGTVGGGTRWVARWGEGEGEGAPEPSVALTQAGRSGGTLVGTVSDDSVGGTDTMRD